LAVTRRRRIWAAVAIVIAAGAASAVAGRVGSSAAPRTPGTGTAATVIELRAGARVVLLVRAERAHPIDAVALRRRLAGRLPLRAISRRGRARISYRYDLDATVGRVLARAPAGGTVQAVRTAISSRILAPVVRQFERNTCEAAALEVLLATVGTRISQRRLQAAFPRSGPLDPVGSGPMRTWGDPDAGYVGRAAGGGTAGGFGIYPRPVVTTAQRFGRHLDDLTGSSPHRVYARLLNGLAVMVWIGLADGPYGGWRSPRGTPIQVNFNEHTIVLTGITRGGDLRVVNPLQGTLERWSRARFEAAWKLLGRRAVGTRRRSSDAASSPVR